MQRPSKPIRHYHRLALYDYTRGASLFITISTAPRRQLFGVVREAVMALSPFGVEVEAALRFTIARAPGLRLYGFVVMPDHIHFRLYLEPGRENHAAMVYFNTVVGKFKSYTTHLFQCKYGGQGVLWQEGFHDWVCESREMIDAVERYMAYNALKWELRHNRANLLKLHEPIFSPRFNSSDFWRGVGEVGFLADERPMVSFRGGHKMGREHFAKVVEAFRHIAADHTIISGFISPIEREVYRALSEIEGAQLVKVLPCAMYHDYQPGVEWLPAIKAQRLAIVARGNSPSEFGRNACLDLNATIVPIAKQNGRALWWQSSGRFVWL